MLRLLTDADFNRSITRGLLRRLSVDLVRAQDAGLRTAPDAVILAYAAADNRIVVSHDISTMTDEANRRVQAGEPMRGLFIVAQSVLIGQAIDELQLRILVSEMDEWNNRVEFIT